MDYSKLRVVYFHSTEIKIDNILWGLLELGLQVENPKYCVPLQEYEEDDVSHILKCLDACDCIVTQNFSAAVAEASYRKNIVYISWVYDAPQRALYMKEAKYPTNYIFSFDRLQVERIKKIGVSNIFYCPLAANVRKASMINLDENVLDYYKGDVSFVGNLYLKDHIVNLQKDAPKELMYLLNNYINSLSMKWNGESVYGKLPPDLFYYLKQCIDYETFQDYKMEELFGCESLIIIPLLAQNERMNVLSKLSERYDVHLFTSHPEKLSSMGRVKIHGKVDHNTEAYKVFFHSKINLNLTMRGIESGVPQRVFDIMSVGGFVMSNYQSEAEILFEPDKEIVLFHDLEELKDKINYYLRHERERLEIALAGYKRVLQNYNYTTLLSYILNKVFG